MTGRVGTEGSIARAAWVIHSVAGRAGGTERLVMQADPVRVEVRFGLRASTDLDSGHKVIWPFDYRDRMADIAFKPNCLLLIIKMFAIVAAETTRRIDVAQVIRICRPINLLVME